MYNVLKPIYIDIVGNLFSVKWTVLGQAKDMAEAKRLFGGAPVLEAVKQ